MLLTMAHGIGKALSFEVVRLIERGSRYKYFLIYFNIAFHFSCSLSELDDREAVFLVFKALDSQPGPKWPLILQVKFGSI